MNIIKNTDSYKMSHFKGYPAGLTEMYSYLESRGGRYEDIVFVGLEPILETLAQGVSQDDLNEAVQFAEKHGVPLNKDGWQLIIDEYQGRLPVEITALPEGSIASPSIPLLTVRNTDPRMAWLTSYLETMLLRVWYPTTVASRIHKMKENIRPYYEETTDAGEVSPFAILDFSSRGVSSLEQSEIGGMAYLMLFQGSDNVPAVDFTNRMYDSEMSGFSVPATEHSIMCSFGEENELASFEYLLENMVEQGGTLSVVSDTWNIFEAVDKWVSLRDKIIEKDVTLVIRPDSGEIEDVLPKVIEKAMMGFGYTMNKKGYRVLNNVVILWGDGINENTGHLPFEIAKGMGVSADSIMTGSGGGLMQADIDRDTCKFAVKGSNVIVDDYPMPISKAPITDMGKRSKSGKFFVFKGRDGEFKWVNQDSNRTSQLVERFHNGRIYNSQNLEEIRDRIKNRS